MTNGLITSGPRLNDESKYLSYLFLVIYTYGHEAGHHTLLANYYSMLDNYGGAYDDILAMLEETSEDPEALTKIKFSRLKKLVDTVDSIINIKYEQATENPHLLVKKQNIEQEGIPDVFGFMLLEYLIKNNNIDLTNAGNALRSFYNAVCPSGASGGHPAGILRANLIKINRFLYNLIVRDNNDSLNTKLLFDNNQDGGRTRKNRKHRHTLRSNRRSRSRRSRNRSTQKH
jgi:hypothetical protein